MRKYSKKNQEIMFFNKYKGERVIISVHDLYKRMPLVKFIGSMFSSFSIHSW